MKWFHAWIIIDCKERKRRAIVNSAPPLLSAYLLYKDLVYIFKLDRLLAHRSYGSSRKEKFITKTVLSLGSLVSCMSALFNFQSLLLVILLLICTCTYIHAQTPSLLDRNKTGYICCIISVATWLFLTFCYSVRGLFWKAARIGILQDGFELLHIRHQLHVGERLSPYVSTCCILMGLKLIFF